MRTRHPFADIDLALEDAYAGSAAAFDEAFNLPEKPAHPDAVERGIELPLGFIPHRGENRRTRRAAVANWQPPKAEGEKMPTRRELLKQRQRQRRGKMKR